MLLKLTYDRSLSKFAFDFNLRCYVEDVYAARGEAFQSSKILSIMALLMPLRRLCSGGSLTVG
jgi:hypothetical protein